MRRLTIAGKEYTFKFSIEASLYNECTEATMNMLLSFGEAQGEVESVQTDNVEDAKGHFISAMRKTFTSVANIPQTALTLFYAGLLEYHGAAGDNTIRSMADAKKVLADYIREREDEQERNFYHVMNLMLEIMAEDHFFDLTGLAKVLNAENGITAGESEKTEKPKKKTGKA